MQISVKPFKERGPEYINSWMYCQLTRMFMLCVLSTLIDIWLAFYTTAWSCESFPVTLDTTYHIDRGWQCSHLRAWILSSVSRVIYKIMLGKHTHSHWRYAFGVTIWLNSLWPCGAIWRHRAWSTLVQVMSCFLTAPSHYLNQCWLTVSEVLWHSPNGQCHTKYSMCIYIYIYIYVFLI